jgi:hypothetical protein
VGCRYLGRSRNLTHVEGGVMREMAAEMAQLIYVPTTASCCGSQRLHCAIKETCAVGKRQMMKIALIFRYRRAQSDPPLSPRCHCRAT